MKNKTIYIHIGMSKTGSSAIQAFLELNEEFLKASDYSYPNPPVYKQAFQATSGNAPFFNEHIINNDTQALQDLLKQSPESNIILSSESLFHTLFMHPEKFSAYFKGLNYKIICYVRRIDDLVESLVNQHIKNHDRVSYSNLKKIASMYDYAECLCNALEFIDKDRFIVRPYEKKQFVDADIFMDFLNCIGLTPDTKYNRPGKIVNPSLNNEALEYRRVLNVISYDALNGPLKIKINGILSSYSVDKNFGRPFQKEEIIPFEARMELFSEFQKKEQRIVDVFFERDDCKLFYEQPEKINSLPEKPSLLLYETAVEITEYIYKKEKNLVFDMYRHFMQSRAERTESVKIAFKAIKDVLKTKNLNGLECGLAFNVISLEGVLGDLRTIYNVDSHNFSDFIFHPSADVKRIQSLPEKKIIEIISTGGDPYFRLKTVPPNCNCRTHIFFMITVPSGTDLQCLFQTRDNPWFNAKNSITCPVQKGYNEIYMCISNQMFNGRLRIDPGSSEGVYQIKEISVKMTYKEKAGCKD